MCFTTLPYTKPLLNVKVYHNQAANAKRETILCLLITHKRDWCQMDAFRFKCLSPFPKRFTWYRISKF
ncbi:hypothetical protein DAPPUDRAFT_249315 [Daphnia pulex]|uniref:Uncharacterized protein n=1 Tax=Daphnia pulex TaxID=6669 RepID=E9GWE4_DAPPU|nr:hypothetical protein DAPPUDRAFT_249315 [Daphnia pulex]|eukprot:EFX76201.1 hypothetical protein DAPPUDRAFT_249315 [Daphnia pulex]